MHCFELPFGIRSFPVFENNGSRDFLSHPVPRRLVELEAIAVALQGKRPVRLWSAALRLASWGGLMPDTHARRHDEESFLG